MVEYNWVAYFVASLIGSTLLLAFSVVVGWFGRFRGAAGGYAMFSAGLSIATIADAIFQIIDDGSFISRLDATLVGLETGAIMLAGIGLFAVLRAHGAGPDRWLMLLAVGVPVFMTVAWAVAGGLEWIPGLPFEDYVLHFAVVKVLQVVLSGFAGLSATAGWLMARAHQRTPLPGQGIIATGVAGYGMVLVFAATLIIPGRIQEGGWWPLEFPYLVIGLIVFPAMVVSWLRHPGHERIGPKVVIAVSAIGFLVPLNYVIYDISGVTSVVSPEILARIVDLVLVTYAVLRFQFLGLEVRLRWGISKSTMAAIFVAVFFIASEAAQQFFGDTFNNNYIGIAAAGLLVLAISPLQRFSDKLATKMVPVGSAEASAQGLRLYRQMAERLAADGSLSSVDRKSLAHMAQEMHIGAGDAADILESVENGMD